MKRSVQFPAWLLLALLLCWIFYVIVTQVTIHNQKQSLVEMHKFYEREAQQTIQRPTKEYTNKWWSTSCDTVISWSWVRQIEKRVERLEGGDE